MKIDTNWAFEAYENIRTSLPNVSFSHTSAHIDNLLDVADRFDVFLLDAFGVLNVGNSAVPGAVETINTLKKMGKQLLVLTNGATGPTQLSVEKYQKFGFHLDRHEVVSSRDALKVALNARDEPHWGIAAASFSAVETLPKTCEPLGFNNEVYERVDGFVLLSSTEWALRQQEMLVETLIAKPRPVLVGNPDIIAPQGAEFSLEPGWFAHELARQTGISPIFYGKPFQNVFDIAFSKISKDISHDRIAMVGDTLHTDVLGGHAAGVKTVLIADHGLFKGHDVSAYIEQSGIVPNYIARTT